MPPTPLFDPQAFPTEVVLDREAIRQYNPQRFEMEQLTAVTLIDREEQLVIGYQDVGHDAFWVRGHMPDFPLMPGVLMCEAGAQLCALYCAYVGALKAGFIGFGGMEGVRFRGVVRPGERLWLVGKVLRHSSRRWVFDMQGFVNGRMVLNGEFHGINIVPGEASSDHD